MSLEQPPSKRVIAYQGEPGANSHLACLEAYPSWQPLPCATFEDAFAAVTDGSAQLAMIPIENSIAGRVADIHHALPSAGLQIVGEYFLPIRFKLLGVKGSSLETITHVYSHVHALGQCRRLIRKLKLVAVISGDTAGSAREVAQWNDPTRASIATKLAGELHGLKVLVDEAEDEKHNTTRFVILSKEQRWANLNAGPTVTTFLFHVRSVPAALYKALGGFATNGVNLTKLESYLVEGGFSAAMFLVDVEGHPEEPGMKRALEELSFFSREVRILGVYPAHPFRGATRPLVP